MKKVRLFLERPAPEVHAYGRSEEQCDRSAWLQDIVRSGTLLPCEGAWVCTSLHCVDRSQWKSCAGFLWIRRRGPEIRWTCPVCRRNGAVRDWKGTAADLSAFRRVPSQRVLPFLVSPAEHRLLLALPLLDGETWRLLLTARRGAQGVVLRGEPEEFAMFRDLLVVDARWERRPARHQLLLGIVRRLRRGRILASATRSVPAVQH